MGSDAATGEGLAASWQLRPGSPDKSPVFDVRLTPAPGIAPDPLLPFVESRAAPADAHHAAHRRPAQRPGRGAGRGLQRAPGRRDVDAGSSGRGV